MKGLGGWKKTTDKSVEIFVNPSTKEMREITKETGELRFVADTDICS